jgi:signal transduction histidine kinase
LETLDLALIHEQVLIAQVLLVGDSAARLQVINRAKAFFAESITPMEKTHRSALEANVHLSRLNQALSRRTLDLASSNRELKKEIARRQVVEEALRQSEQHASKLLQESRSLQEELRLLSRRVLLAQEEERRRISRELHDVIAQMLAGINVRLAALKVDSTASTRGLSRKISHTQRLVEKSVDIVHRFARELRPAMLDDLGLIPALHSFLIKYSKETGIRVSLTAFKGLEKMSNIKRTTLYRVLQEALINVARHAHASRVDVTIERIRKMVCMHVKDNGQSFDVEKTGRVRKGQHLGLLGMRERLEMVGGKLMVVSAPACGTTISARIPFSNGIKGHA